MTNQAKIIQQLDDLNAQGKELGAEIEAATAQFADSVKRLTEFIGERNLTPEQVRRINWEMDLRFRNGADDEPDTEARDAFTAGHERGCR